METYYFEPQAPFEGEPGGFGGADRHPPRRPSGRRPYGALVYVLGMTVATLAGSAFVVGGLLAEARGLNAVALAAAVPLAALLWAITLSLLQRGRGRVRRFDGSWVDRYEDR